MNKLQASAFTSLATLACSTSFNTIAAPGIGGDATVRGNTADTAVSTGGQADVNSIVVSK